ncbi:hypothetical protein ACJX0J_024167, partial [Zea mays]
VRRTDIYMFTCKAMLVAAASTCMQASGMTHNVFVRATLAHRVAEHLAGIICNLENDDMYERRVYLWKVLYSAVTLKKEKRVQN